MTDRGETSSTGRPRVGLFVTCIVDAMRPSVGLAAAKLIEDAGCEVVVPPAQTCCGQPAYNSGARDIAADLARGTIAAFEGCDYIVAPSGSCAGMLKRHYPLLLGAGREEAAGARAFAGRVHELTAFLVDVRRVERVDVRLEAKATYHDACSGLRELKVREQPRKLLASVAGLTLTEMAEPEACCGFGGTFSVKYPAISSEIVAQKTVRIAATGADLLIAGDLGCLLNMAGKLKREGSAIRVRHVAEVLAGMTDHPAIGEGR
ncbi:MAG: (Fe-S)-binding protein [Hyphomicrobiaceae bacterium]